MRLEDDDDPLEVIHKVNLELEPFGLRFASDGKSNYCYFVFDLVKRSKDDADD